MSLGAITISFDDPIQFEFYPILIRAEDTTYGQRLWLEGKARIDGANYSRTVFYAPIELEAIMRKQRVKTGRWYEIFYLGVKKRNKTFSPEYRVEEIEK